MPPDKKDSPDFGNRDASDEKHVFPEESMSNAELASRLRDVENTLAATRAGIPQTQVPEHGAGVGTNIAPTWSLAEQEKARAGGGSHLPGK